jgi:hypothetical protein
VWFCFDARVVQGIRLGAALSQLREEHAIGIARRQQAGRVARSGMGARHWPFSTWASGHFKTGTIGIAQVGRAQQTLSIILRFFQ